LVLHLFERVCKAGGELEGILPEAGGGSFRKVSSDVRDGQAVTVTVGVGLVWTMLKLLVCVLPAAL
jgi:hypothetical protein